MKLFQILFFSAILLSNLANAQCKEVKVALKALNNSKVDSALRSVNRAELIIQENGLETVNEKCLARYYYLKGALNLMIGQDEFEMPKKIEKLENSEKNYLNFLKLNQQPQDLQKIVNSNLLSLSIEYLNVGVEYYQKQDFENALLNTEKGLGIKQQFHPGAIKDQDLFNAMICAKMVKKHQLALTYADSLLANEKLTKDNKIKYLSQKVEILTAAGKSDEALLVIDSLKTLNPNDSNIKLSELQIYLNKDANEQALDLLNEITKSIKNREDLWVIKGQLHYQKSEIDSSIAGFSNALTLNDENYSALYGLGVIYVNKANESVQKMNASNGTEKTAFNEQLKLDFGVAIGYFNKILEFKPKDKDSLNALKMIYNSLGDDANEQLIDTKISELLSD